MSAVLCQLCYVITTMSALVCQHWYVSTGMSALVCQHCYVSTAMSAQLRQYCYISTGVSALLCQHCYVSTNMSALLCQHCYVSTAMSALLCQHCYVSTAMSALLCHHCYASTACQHYCVITAKSICDIDVKREILSIYETIWDKISQKLKVLDQEKLHGIPWTFLKFLEIVFPTFIYFHESCEIQPILDNIWQFLQVILSIFTSNILGFYRI